MGQWMNSQMVLRYTGNHGFKRTSCWLHLGRHENVSRDHRQVNKLTPAGPEPRAGHDVLVVFPRQPVRGLAASTPDGNLYSILGPIHCSMLACHQVTQRRGVRLTSKVYPWGLEAPWTQGVSEADTMPGQVPMSDWSRIGGYDGGDRQRRTKSDGFTPTGATHLVTPK